MVDAVVIGAGPNGLVAANVLADAGWDVIVLEAADTPGGAVRTEDLVRPGFRADVFSAFYPLAAVSPPLLALGLEEHGLRWCHAPLPLAHPRADGTCPALSRDLEETCALLDAVTPGDGDDWRALYAKWERLGATLIDALMRPFPPVLPAARLAALLGPRELVRFARFSLLPVRRMAEESFGGRVEAGALILAGNALHTDVGPESPPSGAFGWLLASLAQQVGFPVPEGGAGALVDALVRRLVARGGTVRCSTASTGIEVRGGRAVAVRTADDVLVPRRAILAAVSAPVLYGGLVPEDQLPSGLKADLHRFHLDSATVKVDWALSAPVPWTAEPARRAGTVHIAESVDELSRTTAQGSCGLIPDPPFLIAGQMTTADASRSPAGTESMWAYTHVPHAVRGDAGASSGARALTGRWDAAEADAFADRMEQRIEVLAPGFQDRILGRHVLTPAGMQERNPSLVDGAINAGTAQIHQQLVFRPVPGLGRPETPFGGLYLASASAHPGGGVHGTPGANAARVALARAAARRAATVAGGAAALGAAAVGVRSRRRR